MIRDYTATVAYNAPSFITLAIVMTRTFATRPDIIEMLPIFYGLSMKNSYYHVTKFLGICETTIC